jgi:hypothetical protein
MVCFLCFSDKPPDRVDAKGASGAKAEAMLERQNNPNAFVVSLASACPKDPLCCCVSTLFSFCGLPACYFRKAVLEKFGRGIEDYVCCQGYIPKMCCVDWPNTCKGSAIGLFCEGCCCPILSLSIARLNIMDAKQIHPDPIDYKIIAFSNFCQLLSCFCNILACFFEELRECAQIIDLIADLITASVAGCMGAQINVELKNTAEVAAGTQMTSPMGNVMAR